MPDPLDGLFGDLPPLDLGESMSMGQPPPPAAPSARARAKEFAPLLALLPIVAARGGQAGVAALLQGFQQSRSDKQSKDRQSQIDAERTRQTAEAERLRRAQLSQTAAQQAAQRRQQVLAQFQSGLQGLDSEEAVRAYLQLYGQQAQSVGLRPEALERYALQALTPTTLQKKEATNVIESAKKQYGDQAVSHTYTLRDGTRANWEELNRRAGVGLGPTVAEKPDLSKSGLDVQAAAALAAGDMETYARLKKVADEMGTARRADPAAAGEKPLTANQRANIISSRRNQWTRFSKAVLDREASMAKIDSGVAALDRGNRNAATQAIIIGFNKLLDETSVVREGEYARSEQLVPIVSRIEGAIQRITQGGASMTDADLKALASEAKSIAAALKAVSQEAAANLREGIEGELDDYKIPHERVFGGSMVGRRTVRMRAPNGQEMDVPADQVEHFKSKGAKVVR